VKPRDLHLRIVPFDLFSAFSRFHVGVLPFQQQILLHFFRPFRRRDATLANSRGQCGVHAVILAQQFVLRIFVAAVVPYHVHDLGASLEVAEVCTIFTSRLAAARPAW